MGPSLFCLLRGCVQNLRKHAFIILVFRRAEGELFGSTGLNNMVVPWGMGSLLSIVRLCVSTAILYSILIV